MAQAHRTYAYRRARQALRDKHLQPCVLCAHPIDYTLTHPNPGSFSPEHLIPARQGGDHTTLAPAHLGCQHRQGAHSVNATRRGDDTTPPRTSGVW